MHRVLLAGLKTTNNQFTRALEKYKVPYVWADPDGRGVRWDCDAVIVVSAQISTNFSKEVQRRYREMKRPVFYAIQGFTEIAEEFEQWVDSLAADKALRKPGAILNLPPAKPLTQRLVIPPIPPAPAPAPEPAKPELKPNLALAKKLIVEGSQAEMSDEEIAELLTAHGLAKKGGGPYQAKNVAEWRRRIEKGEPEETKPALDDAQKMALIAKLLQVEGVAPNIQLQLVKRVQSGSLASTEEFRCEYVSERAVLSRIRWDRNAQDPLHETKIELTRQQAQLLNHFAAEIAAFGEDRE